MLRRVPLTPFHYSRILLMFLGAIRISRLILDLFKFDLHIIVSLELSLWFFTILSSILGILVSTLNEYYVSSVNFEKTPCIYEVNYLSF